MKVTEINHHQENVSSFHMESSNLTEIFECFDWCKEMLGDRNYHMHMKPDWQLEKRHALEVNFRDGQAAMMFKLAWLL